VSKSISEAAVPIVRDQYGFLCDQFSIPRAQLVRLLRLVSQLVRRVPIAPSPVVQRYPFLYHVPRKVVYMCVTS
jgi:hypothetical protein